VITGRIDNSNDPRVILDDGRSIEVEYEVIDASCVGHGDRVRVEFRGTRVQTLLPLLTAAEAITILVDAGVLPTPPASIEDAPWPSELLELVFDHDTTDGTFSHDHHYLEPKQIATWARRSGLSPDDIDGEDSQPHLAINAKLAARKSPYRWFALPSGDPRSAYIRVDRELATKLGLGLFDSR
jgi:hypothetical protein